MSRRFFSVLSGLLAILTLGAMAMMLTCEPFDSKSSSASHARNTTNLPKEIILIRHGEKDKSDRVNLSYKGKLHAACWVKYFSDPPKPIHKPEVIFANLQENPGSSNRPYQTVVPLAEALGITINNLHGKEDYEDLARDISSNSGKTVLISWEHNSIPGIIKNLFKTCHINEWGSDPDKPSDDDDFSSVWVITFDDRNKPILNVYPGSSVSDDGTCTFAPQTPLKTIHCD